MLFRKDRKSWMNCHLYWKLDDVYLESWRCSCIMETAAGQVVEHWNCNKKCADPAVTFQWSFFSLFIDFRSRNRILYSWINTLSTIALLQSWRRFHMKVYCFYCKFPPASNVLTAFEGFLGILLLFKWSRIWKFLIVSKLFVTPSLWHVRTCMKQPHANTNDEQQMA